MEEMGIIMGISLRESSFSFIYLVCSLFLGVYTGVDDSIPREYSTY